MLYLLVFATKPPNDREVHLKMADLLLQFVLVRFEHLMHEMFQHTFGQDQLTYVRDESFLVQQND